MATSDDLQQLSRSYTYCKTSQTALFALTIMQQLTRFQLTHNALFAYDRQRFISVLLMEYDVSSEWYLGTVCRTVTVCSRAHRDTWSRRRHWHTVHSHTCPPPNTRSHLNSNSTQPSLASIIIIIIIIIISSSSRQLLRLYIMSKRVL